MTRQDYFNAAEFLYWFSQTLPGGTCSMTVYDLRYVVAFHWDEWKEIGRPAYHAEVHVDSAKLSQEGSTKQFAIREALHIKDEYERYTTTNDKKENTTEEESLQREKAQKDLEEKTLIGGLPGPARKEVC